LTIYKIIYSGFLGGVRSSGNSLKIKVRPAGLEPATPA